MMGRLKSVSGFHKDVKEGDLVRIVFINQEETGYVKYDRESNPNHHSFSLYPSLCLSRDNKKFFSGPCNCICCIEDLATIRGYEVLRRSR